MFSYNLWYILPALILSLWASARVQSAYRKYSAVRTASGTTGAGVARRILDSHGLTDVKLERVAGEMSDHYDPRTNTVRLSEGVYGSDSVAAVGIAAHECGHALQYAQSYLPIRIRAAIIPATNIGSRLAIPLVLLGILLGAYAQKLVAVAYAGIILFSICVLFQLVTLPVEYNASRRAMAVLEKGGILTETELGGARRMLSAAAMTYVAALAASVLQLLRLIALVGRRRR